MRLSHSRIETFKKCPFQFKLKYIDELETFPNLDENNPLLIGSMLHKAIETDVDTAISEYFSNYPCINDKNIDETIKIKYLLPKILALIPPNGEHEVELNDKDNFIGFIDYLVKVDDNTYDIYDWKYSNNVDRYLESGQLSEYKYYFEKLNEGKKIRNLYFLFVPKSNIRQKKTETLQQFRNRIIEDLSSKEIRLEKIEYDATKVNDFFDNAISAMNCTEFAKNQTRLCAWCDYKNFCEKGDDLMILPSTERRKTEENQFMKIWVYGAPFGGKTYLANQFDTPLMLNTDGNFKQVDAPVVRIVDDLQIEGRLSERIYAWDVFKETVAELEKGSEFKTIIVDLIEDIFDACRIKICASKGWEHESDDSFKAYDIVRNEFLREIKKLVNLPYNIIFISHEDTSKDITKKSGSKITSIQPNLQEKVAKKISGMVDLTCRLINEDGERKISLKSSPFEFGGGRIGLTKTEIPCTVDAIKKLYNIKTTSNENVSQVKENVSEPIEMIADDEQEQPKRSRRRTRE